MGENNVSTEVEVVDVPLDYNILLGRNWIYNMKAVGGDSMKVGNTFWPNLVMKMIFYSCDRYKPSKCIYAM